MDLFGSVFGFEGGNAVRFSHFVFFRVWLGVLCRFFSVLLFLGSLLEKFSGANFCFWVSVSVVFILLLFCLCFCFIIWFVVPGNVSRKFSSGQVRCLHKFSGANFCFMVSVLVCWQFFPLLEGGNAVRFFHFGFLVSGSVSFVVFDSSSFLRVAVLKKFSGANFCFWVSVWVLRVLVLFCLCFCFIICFFAPETVLKKFY